MWYRFDYDYDVDFDGDDKYDDELVRVNDDDYM